MTAHSLPLLALVGPTASGKSDLAIALATELVRHRVAVEIVSADAMQLYRGMDIGTGKVSPAQRATVSHHLLDVWSPAHEASVQDYQRRAREVIAQCFDRGVVPLLVGGSGLYYSSVVYQFEFPGHDPKVRAALEARWSEEGLAPLVSQLTQHDPAAAAAIDLNNPRRVIRALEIIAVSGQSPHIALQARGQLWHEPSVIVGLDWPREQLADRINQRVRSMFAGGLVEEVSRLLSLPGGLGHTARQAIGYREVIDHLEGAMSAADAEELVAQHTRRYARKQLSWFRRDKAIEWHDPQDPELLSHLVAKVLEALGRG